MRKIDTGLKDQLCDLCFAPTTWPIATLPDVRFQLKTSSLNAILSFEQ